MKIYNNTHALIAKMLHLICKKMNSYLLSWNKQWRSHALINITDVILVWCTENNFRPLFQCTNIPALLLTQIAHFANKLSKNQISRNTKPSAILSSYNANIALNHSSENISKNMKENAKWKKSSVQSVMKKCTTVLLRNISKR